MKVLWILNMVLPYVAKEIDFSTSFSGGWLVDYSKRLGNDIDFEIATMTYANVSEYKDIVVDNVRNFIFPGGGKRLLLTSKKTVEDCKKVISEFKPDLIHIHGTEYSIAYSILEVCGEIPVLLTIQGILTRISKEYYGGLSFSQILKIGTLKDWLTLKSVFFMKQLFLKNAKREREVLNKIKYVTGRTDWDKSVMCSINKKLVYYRHNYNLRNEFYCVNDCWNVKEMKPYTIYMGASLYPLKGFHIALDSLRLVKDIYPNVKLYMPGVKQDEIYSKNAKSYYRFISKKIKKLNLYDNIEFIGKLTASEVVKMLKTVNVCLVSSAIEGASATICEAMMVGTPCICAYRGGMTELLKDGESGFYYDFSEYAMLATRIKQLFEDKELAQKFSQNARIDALSRHDRDKNYIELKKIYNEIYYKEKSKR